MSHKRIIKTLCLSVLVAIGLLGASLGFLAFTAQAPTAVAAPAAQPGRSGPAQDIARAWELAQARERYEFRTRIRQTAYPAPSLTGAGRTPQEDFVALEGSVDLPTHKMKLTLWQDASFDPATGQSIRVDGDQAFERSGEGEWEPIENVAGPFAPASDPLAWLAAVKNVGAGQPRTDSLDGLSEPAQYVHYRFELDGPAFAEHVRAQMQQIYQEQGRLPAGMTLQAPDAYANVRGTGELWLDAAGLPARLILEIELPAGGERGRTTATITSDYYGFDETEIVAASAGLFDAPGTWLAQHLPADNGRLATVVALALGLFALITLSIRYHHTAAFYRILAVALIVSMLTTPLLQAHVVHASFEYWSQRRAAAEREQTGAQQLAGVREAPAATMNPQQPPHSRPETSMAAVDETATTLATTTAAGTTALASSSSADSDGDGLSDADEAKWMTCAYAGAPDYCEGVADPTDSDGDSLGDGTEVYRLTTDPARADSDGDGIADNLEVNGFSYNAQMWYLNPNEVDSNQDGLIDAQDCFVWSAASANYDPNAACPDSDGDGVPNPWDDDNDDDGVIDAVDSSPDAVSAQTYDADNPMKLQIDGLQAGEPVFVDLQLRPTEAEHLYYVGNVLDWPTGDTQGQIQRRLDSTFANTDNLALRSTDSLAANGDVRLTPLLEIRIPYTDGHYGNLPVKAAYQGISRTLSMTVGQWLDTSKLAPFGISVRDAGDGSGDLYVYTPLGVQVDDTGGGRAAFSARMLYWPTQTGVDNSVDWAAAHEFRVQWLVQMLQDECTNDDDPGTCDDNLEIIHVYDESWTATGLSIREDHEMSVSILYEDPAQDSDPGQEQDLWPASLNLSNNFLTGRDCDTFDGTTCTGDGQRDVTVANMESQLDTWSGGTDAIEARTFSYEHHAFIAQVNMTETVSLLQTVFEPAGVYTPTLLFAREATARSGNLEDAPALDGTLVVDMSNAETLTSADLSWSTFEYTGSAWQRMDPLRALDLLRLQLQDTAYFQPADSSQQAEDEANGKLLWSELYYSSMWQGMSSVVAIDGAVIWDQTQGTLPQEDFEPAWPTSTFTGATYVAFVFLAVLERVTNYKYGWSQVWESFAKPYFTTHLVERFPRLQTAGTLVMGATAAGAVAGFGLFAYGFFSGDSQLRRTGEIVLNATTVAATSVAIANFVTGLVATARTGGSLTAFATNANNRALGPAGAILQLAVIWGSFAYFGWQAGIFNHPNSIAFNMALAFAVAQTIVLLVLVAISLIPIVGQIIVLLVYLSDAIASFFGEKGAQGWLTTLLAESLYDVDMIIRNLDDPDRLKYRFVDLGFADEQSGYTTNQVVTYTVDVTNTLRYKREHGPDKGKKATFRYYLQTNPVDRHENLELGQMKDEWKGRSGNRIRTWQTAVLADGVRFADVGPGVNRDLAGHLYLTEAFAAPYVGCWQLFTAGYKGVTNLKCTTYAFNGSTHIDLGQYSVFDILPDTLTGFYQWMGSSGDFPAQIDADGDGLVRSVDPGSLTWDSDGDSLGDYYELAHGTNPTKADSDQDGLTDAQEIRFGLNPNDADGDDDGLSDPLEWQGWQVAYEDANGNTHLTWAWPDPASADYDQDSLNDAEEYAYALHPRIANNHDEILDTIQFSEGRLTETDAPQSLLRFEEDAGALTFVDNARQERATCALATCPTTGAEGRYGRGLDFDGTDDYVEAPFVLDPAATEFTAAAWIKPEAPAAYGSILSQAQYMWLYVNSSGYLGTALGGADTLSSAPLSWSTWHHVAVVYDGTTIRLYIDGAYSGQRVIAMQATTDDMTIGARKEPGFVPPVHDYFRGSVDDVVILDRALSESELAELMAGRTNVSDRIVAPGAELEMQMTISNTNPVRTADVVYYQDGDIDFRHYITDTPDAYISFDEGAGATSFAIDYQSGNAVCDTSMPACPTAGVPGISGNAVQFDGNELLKAQAILNGNTGGDGYTIAFWAKPAGRISSKYFQMVMSILDGNGGTAWSDYRTYFSYIVNPNDASYEWLGPAGGPGSTVAPGEWIHIAVAYDMLSQVQRVYVNGAYIGTGLTSQRGASPKPKSNDRVYLGGIQGSDSRYDENYRGLIDEFVFYGRMLDDTSVQALYAGQHARLLVSEQTPELYQVRPQSTQQLNVTATIPAGQPSGSYLYRQLAEAALQIPDALSITYDPALRVHFDEQLEDLYYNDPRQIMNVYPGGRTLLCRIGGPELNYRRCPDFVQGLAGKSIALDGVDEAMTYDTGVAAGGPWTLATWIRPSHTDSSDRAIMGGNNGFPALYLNSSDQLALGRNDNGTWLTYPGGGVVPRNRWSHVAATHDGAGNYKLYLDGVPVMNYVGLGVGSGYASGHLGYIKGSPCDYFQGQMDNFTIYDVALNDSEVAALASQTDLSLHLHLTFDDPPGSTTLTDLTGIYGDATCSNCPLLGIRSVSNRGAYFDSDLLTTAPPDYWTEEAYNSEQFTFAAWVYVGPQGAIAENRSVNRPFRIWTDRWDVGWSTVDKDYDDSTVFRLPDEWVHLVVGHGPAGGGVFVNGVKVASDLGGSPFAGPGSQPFKIGGNNITGYVDDVRLYNRAFDNEDALTLYQTSAPWLQFEFEEGADAAQFEDTSTNGATGLPVNALAGLAGRIGNGVTLNGDGYVEISGTQAIDTLTDTFALMAWVRPEDVTQKQWIIAPAQTASSNGFGLGIENGVLFFETFGNGGLYSSTAGVIANQWQHVALVFDAQRQARFYVDGQLLDTVGGSAPALANGDDPLLIGATTGSGSATAIEQFDGAIDELLIYRRTLSAAEIDSAYINQFRWFRKQFDTYLNVDADAPTITLQTTQTYWPNSYVALAVSTDDPSSAIYNFDFGLQAPGDSAMTWQSALPCQDAEPGVAWCPAFDPTQLGGEGAYQLQFRAVDAVGNETLSQVYTLYVDDTPPTLSVDTSPNLRDIAPDPASDLAWLLPLSGSAADPNVDSVAGSGVYSSSLMVDVSDPGGNSLGGPQMATLSGGNWSLDYRIPGYRPQGLYTVQVTAEDNAGNSGSTSVPGGVYLDEQPPTTDLITGTLPLYAISGTQIVRGIVGDRPGWGGAEARYHFDGAQPFADFGDYGNDATCDSAGDHCPAITAGQFGDAAQFDGVDDYVSIPNLFNPISDTFSISLWFWADGSGTGQRVLVQQANGSGQGRSLLWLDGSNRLASNLGGTTTSGGSVATAGSWHHAALTFDGATLRLYLDGLLEAEATITAEAADGGLQLGSNRGGSAFFPGLMDEVIFYDRVLLPVEVVALAQAVASGVSSVELQLTPVDFHTITGTVAASSASSAPSDIVPATLDNPSALFSSWEATLNAGGLESYYEIRSDSSDVAGNQSAAGTIWRGLIDHVPPQVTASGQHAGGGSAAQTEYTFSMSDFLLSPDNLVQPCSDDQLVSLTYDDPILPYDGQPYEVTATCRVPGWESSRTITACDGAGNCTDEIVYATAVPLTIDKSVTSLAPDEGQVITYTVQITNTSGAEATGVVVSDTLAGELAHGVTLAADEAVTYTYGWTAGDGPMAITNTATVRSDQAGVFSSTVSIDVQNVAPTATDDEVTVSEDGPAVTVDVSSNDSDPAGASDPLSVDSIDTTGTVGTARLSGGTISYDPAGQFEGSAADETVTDTFTYTISDGDGGTATATVTVTVNGQNDAPAFTSTPVTTATEAQPYHYDVTATDVDVGDVLTITAPELPDWLLLSDDGTGTATLSGTPAGDDVGDQNVKLQVEDASGATEMQTFTITIAAAPTDTPTPTPTATATATDTPTPTATNTRGPSPTATDTLTPTVTNTRGPSPTPTDTPTPTPTATAGQDDTLVTDVNGDGCVDLSDVQDVAGRWRAVLGDRLFLPTRDVNDDGIINALDVMRVVADMGNGC